MKPQRLSLNSEALEEFQNNMSCAIETAAREMAKRKLNKGTVTGKIEIMMLETHDKETGEIVRHLVLTPAVKMKIGADAKIDCMEKGGIIMKEDRDGRVIIASQQIGMDELEEENEAGERP